MATPLQVEQYREQGYFITDDAVTPDMLAALDAGARRAVEKVRSGAVVATAEQISTGGPGVEPRNILGLIAPEFGEPIFAEYLMSEPGCPRGCRATTTAGVGCRTFSDKRVSRRGRRLPF